LVEVAVPPVELSSTKGTGGSCLAGSTGGFVMTIDWVKGCVGFGGRRPSADLFTRAPAVFLVWLELVVNFDALLDLFCDYDYLMEVEP